MSKILAMFPGQGSQFVGMGKDLFEQFPEAKETFEQAEATLKIPLKKLCFEGPEADLTLTANTQPCILTVSVAVWRILKNTTGITPAAFAGHSLGEYSAAVASEKLDFARALTLVRRRGEAMQEAVPTGVGAMAAVMNCPPEQLDGYCKEVSTSDSLVQTVNYNSPQQLVVAGHKTAVDQLCQKLESEGIRFVVLQVSAPFHSKLMSKAREAMTPLLNESKFVTNPYKMIANLTGAVADDYGADYLIKQIDNPVRWIQSMEAAHKLGCDTYVEIGPGKVLFGLGRRCLPKGVKLLATAEIQQAITELKQP